jgi:hypothetical protein
VTARRALLAAAALLAMASSRGAPAGAGEDDALASLCDVAEHADRGLTSLLRGEALASAFAPWRPETSDAYGDALRGVLRGRGAASGRAAVLTLELRYARGRTPVYRVWTSLLVGPDAVAVLDLRGEPGGEPLPGDAVPLETEAPGARPFVEAARAIDARVRTLGRDLPAADPDAATEAVRWLLDPGVVRRAVAALPANVSRARSALARLRPDRCLLRVERLSSTLRDAEGRLVATLGGALRLDESGAVLLRLGPVGGPPRRRP